MTAPERHPYTGRVRTVGGWDGRSRSSDGRLDVMLSPPGSQGSGTNPEQLLAAGLSVCFGGALRQAANDAAVVLPTNPVIEAEVELQMAYGKPVLHARLRISLPGLEQTAAQRLIERAHRFCPIAETGRISCEIALSPTPTPGQTRSERHD